MDRRKFIGVSATALAVVSIPITGWWEYLSNRQWVHFYYDEDKLVGKFTRRGKEYALGFVLDDNFDRKLRTLRFVSSQSIYHLDEKDGLLEFPNIENPDRAYLLGYSEEFNTYVEESGTYLMR